MRSPFTFWSCHYFLMYLLRRGWVYRSASKQCAAARSCTGRRFSIAFVGCQVLSPVVWGDAPWLPQAWVDATFSKGHSSGSIPVGQTLMSDRLNFYHHFLMAHCIILILISGQNLSFRWPIIQFLTIYQTGPPSALRNPRRKPLLWNYCLQYLTTLERGTCKPSAL